MIHLNPISLLSQPENPSIKKKLSAAIFWNPLCATDIRRTNWANLPLSVNLNGRGVLEILSKFDTTIWYDDTSLHKKNGC